MKSYRIMRYAIYCVFLVASPLWTKAQSTLIWEELFSEPDGTTSEILESSYIAINDNIDTDESLWEVKDGKFQGSNLLGIGILKTEAINIREYENVSISVEIDGDGPMESDVDFLNVYYRLNNGPRILLNNGAQVADFTETVATASGLNGVWVEIIFEAYNTLDDEIYIIDNIRVEGNPINVPQGNIWNEDFNEFPNGTTIDTGSTAWTIDDSNTNTSTGRFDVQYMRFEAVNVDAVSRWSSEVIDIGSFGDVEITLDAYGFGYLEHSEDHMEIYYKVDGGPEILLQNGFITGLDVPGWTVDPVEASASGINGSTLQVIVDMRNGTDNERFSVDNIKISGTILDDLEVTLSASNIITCDQQQATINTTVNQSGLSFSWTGPNGYASSAQNPVVAEGGIYTVEISNSIDVVIATESITVDENIVDPPLSIDVDGPLTCDDSNVVISALTGDEAVSYIWSGPGGFNATSENIIVSLPEIYTVTVTSDENGCTATSSAEVVEDIDLPTVDIIGDDLTCEITTVLLESTTNASNATYLWTGPSEFTSTTPDVLVSEPGVYFLEVINSDNGCASSASFAVSQDVNIPGLTATGGEVGCASQTVVLTASSTTPGVTYFWIGPDLFTSTEQNPEVSVSGTYEATVTVSATGCSNSETVVVTQNDELPDIIVEDAQVTCTISEVTLTAVTSVSNASFFWVGPGGVALGTEQTQLATEPGSYTVTITAANSCTNQATALVSENILIPDIIVYGGTLTCVETSVNLLAATSIENPIISWTGPNGFTADISNPEVEEVGLYEATVTDPINGCSNSQLTFVSEFLVEPGVTIDKTNDISCTESMVVLSAESTTTGVAYEWEGPDDFTSALQFPTVTTGGEYIVHATYSVSGCVSTDTIEVVEDSTAPELITTGNIITCNNTVVTITASTELANPVYSWTGPNGYTSDQQNPSVSEPGNYIVSVTDEVTGCTNSEEAIVTEDTDQPDLTVTSEGELTCGATDITLTASSTNGAVSFAWTGPNEFSASINNPTVDEPGDYTVTITDPVTGCTNTSTINLEQNDEAPDLSVIGGEITCNAPNLVIEANSSVTGVTFEWTGPDPDLVTDIPSPTVDVAGEYTVVITNPATSCTNTASVNVTENTDEPTITQVGSDLLLNCNIQSVELEITTDASSPSYTWTGPDSFTSIEPSPEVDVPGIYSIIVTNEESGCFSTSSIVVSQDITVPDLTASGNEITCDDPNVIISASSSTTDVTYSWIGPDNFTSTVAEPTVSIPGAYNIEITNPANGCTNDQTVTVIENTDLPAIAVSKSGDLNCLISSVDLTSNTDASSPFFNWTGPAFSSPQQNVTVSEPGVYIISVVDLETGCFTSEQIVVEEDIVTPDLTTVGNEITCTEPNVIITASSFTPDVEFSWTGPDEFTSGLPNPAVDLPGTYTATATNTENGCFSTENVEVTENVDVPAIGDVTGNDLNCIVTSSTLSVDTDIVGADFLWTGPNDFESDEASPLITESGVYDVTVIDPNNGCSATGSINIEEESTPPDVTVTENEITCSNLNVEISASSITPDVTFSWDGPDSFSSSIPNPIVDTPGDYFVTVTNTTTGCFTTSQVVVADNTAEPVITTTGATITCTDTEVTIGADSDITNAAYLWFGPGFNSSNQNPTVSDPGVYTVVVTNPDNQCFATGTVNVAEDIVVPDLSANGGEITCDVSEVTIEAFSSTPNVTYSWTGPGEFASSDPSAIVSVPGNYAITITNPTNGCSSSGEVPVLDNRIDPDVSLSVDGDITCAVSEVTISATSNTSGVTYLWETENFISEESFIIVDFAETYEVIVTDPSNGCTTIGQVEVLEDIASPDLFAEDGVHTCITDDAGGLVLTTSSSVLNLEYQWTVPAGLESLFVGVDLNSSTLLIDNTLITGTFLIEATDPINGCSTVEDVEVTSNAVAPDCSITLSGDELSSVTIADGSYNWVLSNSDWSILNGQGTSTVTLSPGPEGSTVNVSLEVVDNDNGCLEDCSIDLELIGGVITNISSSRTENVNNSKLAIEEIELGDSELSAFEIDTYPNPFTENATISFIPNTSTDLVLKLYSLSGQEQKTLFDEYVLEGETYTIQLTGDGLTDGIYIYHLITKDQVYERKIVFRK